MSYLRRLGESAKRFFAKLLAHPVSLAGTVATTSAAVVIFGILVFQALGFEGHFPYQGILAFSILMFLFLGGLVLIPIGLWLGRRRARALGAAEPELPVLDFNLGKIRRFLFIFLVLTMMNVTILGIASYKAITVMETTKFCGTTCHTVMRPEYTTYLRSPHARVRCVECHIGSGANWFVKSKISGSWQMVSVAFDLYPRPIESPVHSLRPARDTCEECHWPQKFMGDRLKIIPHYQDDEQNTETKTVLILRVGGMTRTGSQGIHWHVDPKVQVKYESDDKRENIYHVECVKEDGTRTDYYLDGKKEHPQGRQRVMDCVDCHNRPAHVFRLPADEMDRALSEGKIDRSLPFVKKEGLELLQADYPSQDEAKTQMRNKLIAFYRQKYPHVIETQNTAVEAAAAQLGTIYATNVFPDMKVTWGAHPNHIGHEPGPGCFRCHDGNHKTLDGKAIADDCETCHSSLAVEEKDPEVLKQLNL